MTILIAALLIAVTAQAHERQELVFANALLVAGEVEFDAAEPIDWGIVAPKEWTNFELSDATPEFLTMLREQQNMFDDAELVFEAPVPESLREQHFYYISDDGVQEVRADHLKGAVRFSFARNGELVDRISYGSVVGIPLEPSSLGSAGFVVVFENPRAVRVAQTARLDREFLPQTVRSSWEALSPGARALWAIDEKYAFRFEGQAVDHILVRWAPDRVCEEACCALRYSIFTDASPPATIASMSAACDI